MSLVNKRIVVTRAAQQTESLVKLLQGYGAIPLVYPCLDIRILPEQQLLDAALRNLKAYDWLIFTSINAVLAIKNRLEALDLSPDWRHLRIAAVGTSTSGAIEDYLGARVEMLPDEQSAAGLSQAITIENGMRVLLPQSTLSRPDLENALRQAGADVNAIDTYENVIGTGGEDVPAMLRAKLVDALTFASPSAVSNFIKRISPERAFDLPAACIGPSTAETAYSYGFMTIITPSDYSIEAMLERLDLYFTNGE